MPGPRLLPILLAASLLSLALASPLTHAQETQAPPAPLSHPLDGPVVRAEAVFTADRAVAWRDEAGDQWVRLQKDVRFELGAYGFRGQAAVVRVHTQRRPGRTIRRLAIVIDQARPLRGAGSAVSASADRLLVTAATSGELKVRANLFTPAKASPGDGLTADAQARIAHYQRRRRDAVFTETIDPLYGPAALARRRERRAQIAKAQRPLAQVIAERPSPGEVEAGPSIASTAARPGVLPTSGVVRFSADRIVFQPGDQENALMLIGQVRVLYQASPPPGSNPGSTPGSTPASTPASDSESDLASASAPASDHSSAGPSNGSQAPEADLVDAGQPGGTGIMATHGGTSAGASGGGSRGGASARSVTLQAERVVVLLDPKTSQAGAMGGLSRGGGGSLRADVVRGVYLEDNAIATAGGFTVRAPRVFYDLQRNRAVLLQAVLYTYDVKRQVPLYLRAAKLQQTSAHSFEARGAMLTTSEFAQPLLSIRADKVTFDQKPGHDGAPATQAFTATDTTLNAQGVPFFYWPYLAGHGRTVPLRRAQVGYDSHGGPEIKTRWDLFALAGHEAPDGVDLTGDLDYRGDRGPGLGANLDYDTDSAYGRLRGYLLPNDHGEDAIGNREDIGHDGDTRGFIHAQHRQILPNGFELSGELGYTSDPTFLEEFFPDQAYEQKPYETSLYLKKQRHNGALTALAKTNLNNFLAQPDRLEAPGFTVERALELGAHQIGPSLLNDRLSWYSQTTVSRLRADFGGDTPADRGFTQAQAQALFGLNRNTSFEDAADAINFPDQWVTRLDTRQELSAPLSAGPISVTPYVVGRVTAYDQDFDEFNGGNDDQIRLRGSVGTRFRTQISRAYGQVESSLLDLHHLRHIIEPHADVFFSESTINPQDLPPYDFGVETLAQGGGLRLGLTQTLQTQRGRQDHRRSVDWLKLTTDVVLRPNDAQVDRPIAHFFDYRPEYTVGGDHFYTELTWMVSDTLGISGQLTHSFETGQVAQWSLGATLRHTPRLTSFVRYDQINALSSRLLSYGFVYQLTTKYRLRLTQRFDFDRGGPRSLDLGLERELAHWRLRVLASFNQVDDEQTVGVVFTPKGLGGNDHPLDLLQ